MVYKIIWSALAIKTYVNNIEYLEKEWSEKEVINFIVAVQQKIFFTFVATKVRCNYK